MHCHRQSCWEKEVGCGYKGGCAKWVIYGKRAHLQAAQGQEEGKSEKSDKTDKRVDVTGPASSADMRSPWILLSLLILMPLSQIL